MTDAPLAETFDLPHFERSAALPKAFIVGCQKSGTTWLQQLLGAHPQICSGGEACFGHMLTPLVGSALKTYNENQRAGRHNTFTNDETVTVLRAAICALYARWLGRRADPGTTRLIAEKTPEHAMQLDVLSSIFPGCRVVHIIRDGRDGVVSGWYHNLREKPDEFRARFPEMATYAAYFAQHHWVPYINSARAWGARHPADYIELRYEALLADPIGHTERLFEFLGVDADPGTIGVAVEAASFKKASGGRDSGQADAMSHYRKGVVGDWQNELDEGSVRAFEAIGAGMLDNLGYARSDHSSTVGTSAAGL